MSEKKPKCEDCKPANIAAHPGSRLNWFTRNFTTKVDSPATVIPLREDIRHWHTNTGFLSRSRIAAGMSLSDKPKVELLITLLVEVLLWAWSLLFLLLEAVPVTELFKCTPVWIIPSAWCVVYQNSDLGRQQIGPQIGNNVQLFWKSQLSAMANSSVTFVSS